MFSHSFSLQINIYFPKSVQKKTHKNLSKYTKFRSIFIIHIRTFLTQVNGKRYFLRETVGLVTRLLTEGGGR